MRDWLESIPNLGVPGVPGVPPQKSATSDGKHGVPAGVPGVPAEHLPIGTNPQKTGAEHKEHVAHGISEQAAKALLRDWHGHLSKLERYEPPEGFRIDPWAMLVEDCWWIYSTHCSRLVREGWSVLDLFGVFPHTPGGGGLADRLQGARNVLFTDDRAHWTRSGVKFWTCRGACEGLEKSGLVLVWELGL